MPLRSLFTIFVHPHGLGHFRSKVKLLGLVGHQPWSSMTKFVIFLTTLVLASESGELVKLMKDLCLSL